MRQLDRGIQYRIAIAKPSSTNQPGPALNKARIRTPAEPAANSVSAPAFPERLLPIREFITSREPIKQTTDWFMFLILGQSYLWGMCWALIN